MPHARKDLIDVEEICKYIIDPDAYITSSANKQDLKAILNRRAGGIPPVSLMLAGKNRSLAQGTDFEAKIPRTAMVFRNRAFKNRNKETASANDQVHRRPHLKIFTAAPEKYQ